MDAPGAGYIHGFSATEQERLFAQAEVLEPMVFEGVDFGGRRRLLEVGCGVGAQTRILLRRFPGVAVTAVDLSESQLARARAALAGESGVRFERADAEALPFGAGSYDAAFLCWVLEHARRPAAVLRELFRVLGPGAGLHGIEVMNASLRLWPACPAVMEYWGLLNRRQEEACGDPFVGARAGALLHEAGFAAVSVSAWTFAADARDPARRAAVLDYWESLLLSAAPELEAAGLAGSALVARVRAEFAALKADPGAAFFYTPVKFSATRP